MAVRMNKGGGLNCCIVGCHTNSTQCRGMSFPGIPKASDEQDKIQVSDDTSLHSVNRADKSFNPSKAKICSRHFADGCIKYGVLGALFSAFIIWLVSGVLCYIAVECIVNKHYMDVKPDEMLITASLGVVFNLVAIWLMFRSSAMEHANTADAK